jgi:hypothetical protein
MDYAVGDFCRICFTTQGTTVQCSPYDLQPVVYPKGTTIYALTNGFLFRCTSLIQGVL